MSRLHCQHLRYDIDQYKKSVDSEMDSTSSPELADKQDYSKEMVDKWSIKLSLADKLADILLFVDDKQEFTTESIIKQFRFSDTTNRK